VLRGRWHGPCKWPIPDQTCQPCGGRDCRVCLPWSLQCWGLLARLDTACYLPSAAPVCIGSRDWTSGRQKHCKPGKSRLSPICSLADGIEGSCGVPEYLVGSERGESACPFQNTAIDNDRIDIGGLNRFDDHMCRVGEDAQVDAVGGNHDDVRPLSRLER